MLDNISFTINKGEKVALLSRNDLATTTLFKILTGELQPDTGSFKWGVTTSRAYLPKDTSNEFDSDLTILEWLRQYAPVEEQDNTFLRSFLGRMLFSGDDVMKQVRVLSGGEKVRCILAKMMLSKANVLLLDDPTNHLDLESITALNDGMIAFKGSLLFTSHDYEFINTTANRIIEVSANGVVDRLDSTYEESLKDSGVPGSIWCLPPTMFLYIEVRPFTSSDFTVSISCKVYAAPYACNAHTSISPKRWPPNCALPPNGCCVTKL